MTVTVYVIKNDKKVSRSTEVASLEITYKGNDLPSINLSCSAKLMAYFMKKCHLRIAVDDEICDVEVTGTELDSVNSNVVNVTCVQIFNEWDRESIPVNISKKKSSIKSLLSDKEFVYQKNPWRITYDASNELDQEFEYEFSRETKLDGLDKALNLTTSVMKRIPRNTKRVLQIGVFGEKKLFRITENNLLSAGMSMDASNIKNLIVPIADKSDGGASSLTLRDLLDTKSPAILKDFPIINTGTQVNTQAMDVGYDYPQYAPNNKNEYAVIDAVGLELEDGEVYEGTFTANDLQPIQEDGKKISNEDRIKATLTLYNTVVRLAKNSRRQLTFNVRVTELPTDIDVLDKVQLSLSACYPNYDDCMSDYERNIYAANDWFYVTEIKLTRTDCGWTYGLTLSKDLAGILGSRIN